MITDDLRRLGVKVNQILLLNPTNEQLKRMRDGLVNLRNHDFPIWDSSINIAAFIENS